MKVAVMGAGLSGLACAIELERHGLQPDIFEKRSQVGDRFVNAEVLLSVFSRPIADEISYLAEKHQLYLTPSSNIKQLQISGPNNKALIEGHLGFTTIRGRHPDSWEQQLRSQLQTSIEYHSDQTYEQLLRDYTHVVVATGDAAYTQKISQFHVGSRASLTGVTVKGDFSRAKVNCWLNHDFAPGGYGYLIPYTETEANLVLAIPHGESYDKASNKSVEGYGEYWKKFFRTVCTELDQTLTVTDTFAVSNYLMGICGDPRIGNSFFTGNCFGTLMPFLGFGQFPSILTGIYAAQDIVGLSHYAETTAPLRQSYRNSLRLRHFLERLGNDDIDAVVSKLNGYWGRKMFTSHRDILKWVAYGLQLWSAGTFRTL